VRAKLILTAISVATAVSAGSAVAGTGQASRTAPPAHASRPHHCRRGYKHVRRHHRLVCVRIHKKKKPRSVKSPVPSPPARTIGNFCALNQGLGRMGPVTIDGWAAEVWDTDYDGRVDAIAIDVTGDRAVDAILVSLDDVTISEIGLCNYPQFGWLTPTQIQQLSNQAQEPQYLEGLNLLMNTTMAIGAQQDEIVGGDVCYPAGSPGCVAY
jgi:hypothetical protein